MGSSSNGQLASLHAPSTTPSPRSMPVLHLAMRCMCAGLAATTAASALPHALAMRTQRPHMLHQEDSAAPRAVHGSVANRALSSKEHSRATFRPPVPQEREYVMKCVDGPPRTHACYFEGLLYDTQELTFHFPWLANAEEQLREEATAGAGAQRAQGTVRIQKSGFQDGGKIVDEHMEFFKATSPESNFNIHDPLHPSPSEVCVISAPTHLRNPYNANSFGHLLRDNMQALVEVAANFDLDAGDFRWTMWPGVAYAKMPHVVQKYAAWMGGKSAKQWSDLLAECEAANGGRLPRYLQFSKVIASGSGSDWTGGAKTPLCTDEHFKPLRTLAYRVYGLRHIPVVEQEAIRLTFLTKDIGEKRSLSNVEELVAEVNARFPHVTVELHAMQRERPDEQMRTLSQTSILVSNVGSSSFRQIYLPDGGQVILIGALENPFVASDGNTYRIPGSFREVNRCWDGVEYYKTLRYHILDESEIARHEGRPNHVHDKDWEVKRVWDADVTVDVSRFLELLQLAVDAIEDRKRSWRLSYKGSQSTSSGLGRLRATLYS